MLNLFDNPERIDRRPPRLYRTLAAAEADARALQVGETEWRFEARKQRGGGAVIVCIDETGFVVGHW